MNATPTSDLLASLKLASSQRWFENHPVKDLAERLFAKIDRIEDGHVYINTRLNSSEMDLLCQTGAIPGLHESSEVRLAHENL